MNVENKKGITVLFMGLIFLVVVTVSGLLAERQRQRLSAEMDNIYPKTTVVVEIRKEENIVVCKDFNGFTWTFEGVEDWEVDDVCSMIMNSKGTETILDDEIIKIQYNGFTIKE